MRKLERNYATGVLGSPVTRAVSVSFQRPNFFNTSILSKRFKTLRFVAVLALPKLGWRDMTWPLFYLELRGFETDQNENFNAPNYKHYFIFGMNTNFPISPSSALAWSLKPFGRLSFKGPVFGLGARCFLGKRLRLSDCLLMRTIWNSL